ncbi:MAG: NAD(P)/FAD-dependent oxidoreductase [Chloroflexota bacterium]
MKKEHSESHHVQFAIIGAGFGGLGMGIRLRLAGRQDFIIFERASEIGGTWRDNTYPGCACDIPSIVYSFSFDQNPEWSRLFPTQPEILAYLKQCVKRFQIEKQIQFNTDIQTLKFDEDEGVWHLKSRDGREWTAQFVVSAMGPLNRPHIPNITGLDQFEGTQFHSSNWNHDHDLTGKRVAVIGTGASAIQFVPQIAPQVQQLSLFQRTPPWIVPRDDAPVSENRKRWLKNLPFLQSLLRGRRYWVLEAAVLNFLGNKTVANYATSEALKHINNSISDPELRRAVTPDYKFGCKRALVSDDYYPALERENVDLITSGIQEIRANSIIDQAGVERPIDTIILGTGFVASEFLVDMKINGRKSQNGQPRELLTEWKDTGPEAYFGISTSGYPNLFFLLGPNTGLGHNSVILMMESQYNYIMDYVRYLEKENKSFLDIDPTVQAEHNAEIQEKLKSTVWQTGGCTSWYQLGNGKNTTLWPGSTIGYRRITRKVHKEAYL